jgi:hypothetical protein
VALWKRLSSHLLGSPQVARPAAARCAPHRSLWSLLRCLRRRGRVDPPSPFESTRPHCHRHHQPQASPADSLTLASLGFGRPSRGVCRPLLTECSERSASTRHEKTVAESACQPAGWPRDPGKGRDLASRPVPILADSKGATVAVRGLRKEFDRAASPGEPPEFGDAVRVAVSEVRGLRTRV